MDHPPPLIAGMGGNLVEPTGFIIMNVKVPCIRGYDEDQVALVMDDPGMVECPVILALPPCIGLRRLLRRVKSPSLPSRGPHPGSHG